MMELRTLEPIDYLVVGHITVDLIEGGFQIGGTACYSALAAKALGMRVGIVTSWASETMWESSQNIPISNYPTEKSTTFENIYTLNGRQQKIYHVAPSLDYYQIPDRWRSAPIVHLAPVAQEVEPLIIRNFPNALMGITPQGWMRKWDSEGNVGFAEWPEAKFVLERCGAVVISLEDVKGDEAYIEELATYSRVLVVTEGAEGSRLYWNGDVRSFRAPSVQEVDSTGAGDVFAAAFFTRLYMTRDPWEAARFATGLASNFVTRPGVDGFPTPEEMKKLLVEVF